MASNTSKEYLAINIVLSSVATIAIALRFLARWRQAIHFGADDVLIFIGWKFLVGLNIGAGIMYGASGLDGIAITDGPGFQTMIKAFYAIQILYYLCMLPTKLSILAMYARIFSPRKHRLWIYFVMGLCICWFLGGLLSTVFQCSPIQYIWLRGQIDGTCVNSAALFWAITTSNFLTDLIILLMPLFMIYHLKLTMKQKLVASITFLSGSAATICALLRVISNSKFGGKAYDLVIDCGLWITLEPALAMTSACLPSLRPLIPAERLSKWYYSITTSSTRTNESTRKSRRSWFGLDFGRSARDAYNSTTIVVTTDPNEYSTENSGRRHTYEKKAPRISTRDSRLHVTESWEDMMLPLTGIHVRQEIQVDNQSLR